MFAITFVILTASGIGLWFAVSFMNGKIVNFILYRNKSIMKLFGIPQSNPEVFKNLRLKKAKKVELISNGNLLDAYYLETAVKSPKAVVFYSHGQKSDIYHLHRIHFYQKLLDAGYDVFIYDYSGFGLSEGEPSREVVFQNSISAYEHANKIKRDLPLLMYGHSLGTAITLECCIHLTKQKEPIFGIVLEAPFYNMERQLSFKFNFNVCDYLPSNVAQAFHSLYDNSELLKQIDPKIPIMILHSPGDITIPIEQAKELFLIIQKRNLAEFIELEPHVYHAWISRSNIFNSVLENFIKKIVNYKSSISGSDSLS